MGSSLIAIPKSTSLHRNKSYDIQIVKIGPTIFAQLTLLANPQNPMLCNGQYTGLKVPLPMAASAPLSNTWFSGSTWLSIPIGILIGSAVFCTAETGRFLYLTMGHLFPMGDLDPHVIHGSLGPLEPTTQTASRLVRPFLQGSLLLLTDRPRYSVGNNRPHCYG